MATRRRAGMMRMESFEFAPFILHREYGAISMRVRHFAGLEFQDLLGSSKILVREYGASIQKKALILQCWSGHRHNYEPPGSHLVRIYLHR